MKSEDTVALKKKISLGSLYDRFGILLILIIMCVVSAFLSPVFMTPNNLINIVRQVSVIVMIAFGETMLIISGQIDLSPGSVVAFVGVIAADVMAKTGNVLLAAVAGIIVGIATGAINGYMITKFKLPPFIMTLAMMMIARSAAFIYTDAVPIAGLGDFAQIGQGNVGFVPIPVIIMLVLMFIAWFTLRHTRLGRYTYAIGGNEDAAKASGINVNLTKLKLYLMEGFMVGVAGIVLVSRVNSGQPSIGEGYEFDAITGAIVGGTSFTGGIGTIPGTLIGALIVGVLNNILNLMNVSSYYQDLCRGLIIAVAVTIDIQTRLKSRNK